MLIHLDLNKARNAFKELTQKDWIANTVVFFRFLFRKRKYIKAFFCKNSNFEKKYFVSGESLRARSTSRLREIQTAFRSWPPWGKMVALVVT